jgi:hypothetical protein
MRSERKIVQKFLVLLVVKHMLMMTEILLHFVWLLDIFTLT